MTWSGSGIVAFFSKGKTKELKLFLTSKSSTKRESGGTCSSRHLPAGSGWGGQHRVDLVHVLGYGLSLGYISTFPRAEKKRTKVRLTPKKCITARGSTRLKTRLDRALAKISVGKS